MGDLSRRRESRGSLERLPGNRPSGDAELLRVCLHGSGAAGRPADFHIAGSGEAPEGKGNYQDHIIRRGDTSPGGLREKARYVLGEMERRMTALGFGLGAGHRDAALHGARRASDPRRRDRPARRAPGGLTWHFARPPVVGLDFEMDVRGVAREIVL